MQRTSPVHISIAIFLIGSMLVFLYVAPSIRLLALFDAIVLGTLWVVFFYHALLAKKNVQKYELNCPSCGQNLTNIDIRKTLVATGNCGRCGSKVLEEG